MKQTNASPKHSSLVYYLGTLAMLASMLLLPLHYMGDRLKIAPKGMLSELLSQAKV